MPIESNDDFFDVAVAGGGPAGAATATILADYGHSVLLAERESIPRLHVGESLIPAANVVLHRLGMIDELLESDFPKKYSVQFVSANGRESAPFYFDEFESTGLGHTWQVVRATFDRMLVENARRHGVTVKSNTRLRPLNQGPPFSQLELTSPDARPRRIGCRVFVDATGQSALIGSQLGLKQMDPFLKNATIWTHFRSAYRDSGRDAGATIIFQSSDHKSWFWFIPLPDDVVSVGCTGRLNYLFAQKRSAESVFGDELARCPALACRLHNAECVESFRTTKDFSYKCRPGAGDGWVMVGDAYGFIDPVYSSGAFLALKSGELAADAIHDAIVHNDISAKRLGAWQSSYDSGVQNFQRLVHAFYDDDFNFGRFLARYPEHRDRLTAVLVGNVFDSDVSKMFVDIESSLGEPQNTQRA